MSITFKIMDHTGDTVQTHEKFRNAKKAFNAMMHSHLAYNADNNTIINKLDKDTSTVIFTPKLRGG